MVADQDHTTYENYMRTPEGCEFKAMEERKGRGKVTVTLGTPNVWSLVDE